MSRPFSDLAFRYKALRKDGRIILYKCYVEVKGGPSAINVLVEIRQEADGRWNVRGDEDLAHSILGKFRVFEAHNNGEISLRLALFCVKAGYFDCYHQNELEPEWFYEALDHGSAVDVARSMGIEFSA